MNLKQKTYNILNAYGLKAKKRFGQNFLVDENIIDEIVQKSNITNEDIIIEIGPGLGNLTEKLLEKAKTVIAFEIDEDMIRVLNGRFKDASNFILINDDILKADLQNVLQEKCIEQGNVKVVANLPYYITTPIMFKVFEQASFIQSMTIMVQKEVADRIIASPKSKDYGVLTVNTKYYGDAVKLFDVPNTAFVPAPNVTSSIVKIEIISRYKAQNSETFFKLVKAAFSQRRKKLINSLENSNVFNLSKQQLKDLLLDSSVKENSRAEELDIQTYIDISNKIYNQTKKSED